jgi:glycine betaine/proline transport system substrate-binding protein
MKYPKQTWEGLAMTFTSIRRSWIWVVSIIGIAAIISSACGSSDATSADATPIPGSGPLKFVDNGWGTNKVASAIMMFVIENGYDEETVFLEINDQAKFEEMITDGRADVIMETWHSEYTKWYGIAEQRERIGDRGVIYEDGQAGWFIPTAVVEANPGIENVETLAAHADLFNGQFVSCPTTWPCAEHNQIKLDTYGLSSAFTATHPETFTALEETLSAAGAAGTPIIGYFREPSWLLESQDWTRVEEPEWTQLCWARVNNLITGKRDSIDEHCQYPTNDIETALYRGVFGTRFDMPPLFFRMTMGRDNLMATVKYYRESGGTLEQAAVHFLTNNDAEWRKWVADDAIAAKIDAALSGS